VESSDELNQEDPELTLPPWIGNEVTGDSFYKKINMRERAVKAHRQEYVVRPNTAPVFVSG
jgi:CYTH domain-containing protein